MTRERFDRLPNTSSVFRITSERSYHLPVGEKYPNMHFFEPSTQDKEEAEKQGRKPGLSAWDRKRTTVAEAVGFRSLDSSEIRAFGLKVGDIHDAGKQFNIKLEVVRDPLPAELGSGADGHCLIEGLSRPKNTNAQPKKIYKELRRTLAAKCEAVE